MGVEEKLKYQIEKRRGVFNQDAAGNISIELSICDDSFFQSLPTIPRLVAIKVLCSNISDASFKFIAKQPSVEVIDLTANRNVTGKGISALSALSRIRVMRLGGMKGAFDEVFETAGVLENLTDLDVSVADGSLSPENIMRLPGKIERLSAVGCKISESATVEIARKKNLQHLDVAHCELTNEGVRHVLQGLPSLRKLRIVENKEVTDEIVPDLIKAKSLRYLDACGTGLSSKGIIGLIRNAKLSTLYVCDVGLDDGDFADLNLKEITDIALLNCGLSQGTIEQIRMRNPKCEVLSDFDE